MSNRKNYHNQVIDILAENSVDLRAIDDVKRVLSELQLENLKQKRQLELEKEALQETLEFFLKSFFCRLMSRELESSILIERDICARLVEAEHVGNSVDDKCTNPADRSYNMALRHASAAIRKRSGLRMRNQN